MCFSCRCSWNLLATSMNGRVDHPSDYCPCTLFGIINCLLIIFYEGRIMIHDVSQKYGLEKVIVVIGSILCVLGRPDNGGHTLNKLIRSD